MKKEEEKNSGKKKKYSKLIIVFSIVVIGVLGTPKVVDFYKYYNYKYKQQALETPSKSLYRREAIKKDDGWYYFIENTVYELHDTNEKVNKYYINGCNIKHETLDYDYGTAIDGDLSYNPSVSSPALVTSHRSVDGTKTESEEAREINELFNKHLFDNKKITENDLNEIEFKNFNSDDIVTLWNMVQDDKYIKSSEWGPYIKLNVCNFKKENKEKNYWQVGVLSDYGFPKEVVIDYVDKNGKYLSDKIANNEATEDEKMIYNNIQEMGNYIVDNVTFNIKDKYKNLTKDNFYVPLFALLKELESVKK